MLSEIPFFGTAKNSISLNRLKPIIKRRTLDFDCLGSSFSSLLLVFHVIVSDSCIFPHYHQELSHSINFIIFFTAFTTFDDKYIFCNFLLEYAHIGLFRVFSINTSIKYLSQLTYFLLSI